MQELNFQEVDMVSGASTDRGMAVVYDTAAGVLVGGAIGFLCGGPVGAVAGAISGGGHALLIGLALE